MLAHRARRARAAIALPVCRAADVQHAPTRVAALAAELVVELDAERRRGRRCRAGASSVSTRTALSRQRPRPARERVLGVQLGSVVLAERRRDAALRVPAVRRQRPAPSRAGARRPPRRRRARRRAPRLRRRRREVVVGSRFRRHSAVFSSESITCERVYQSRFGHDHALPRGARRRPPGARRRAPGAAVGARARPVSRRWSLPGGYLVAGETLEQSIRRHLATKVDVRELSHLEQLETLQRARPQPAEWELATAYLGLVPSDVDPAVPADTAWHPVDDLPAIAFDHGAIVLAGRERLRAKLSYTNVGFALAPDDVHDLRAARPLPRRARPRRLGDEPPARAPPPPPARADRRATARPARPAAAPRRSSASAHAALEITDQFAVLRPPGIG